MTDLDLTDAVEAAARAWFERGQSGRMDAGRGGNIVRTKPITQRLKAKILKRDGHACVECGATPGILHVAHIEDYRINGNNHPDNLRTLCPECHAAEGGD